MSLRTRNHSVLCWICVCTAAGLFVDSYLLRRRLIFYISEPVQVIFDGGGGWTVRIRVRVRVKVN